MVFLSNRAWLPEIAPGACGGARESTAPGALRATRKLGKSPAIPSVKRQITSIGASLRIVSGLAENTSSIFYGSSSELEAANGCPVLPGAGITSREAHVRRRMTRSDGSRYPELA